MRLRSKSMAELIQLYIYVHIYICMYVHKSRSDTNIRYQLSYEKTSCSSLLPVESFCAGQFLLFGALREAETSFLFINRFWACCRRSSRSVRFSYKQKLRKQMT